MAVNAGLKRGEPIFIDACTLAQDPNFGQGLANMNDSIVYTTSGYSHTATAENGDVTLFATTTQDKNSERTEWTASAPKGSGASSIRSISSVTAHKDGSATIAFKVMRTGSRLPQTEYSHVK
jgi:uncharacterized protein YegP (UPF0339 family)